jgi:hypothetical protein
MNAYSMQIQNQGRSRLQIDQRRQNRQCAFLFGIFVTEVFPKTNHSHLSTRTETSWYDFGEKLCASNAYQNFNLLLLCAFCLLLHPLKSQEAGDAGEEVKMATVTRIMGRTGSRGGVTQVAFVVYFHRNYFFPHAGPSRFHRWIQPIDHP